MLRNDFDSVSSNIIPNNISQAQGFYLFSLNYSKEEALRFVDNIDNLNLTIKLIKNN